LLKTINDYEILSYNKNYAFRGQHCESFELLPGTYRKEFIKNYSPALERNYVYNFIQHLRKNGFHNQMAGLQEYDIFTRPFKIFPEEDLLQYLALAQHYSYDSENCWLKTSLLDITFNLDVAAYFAVINDLDNAKIYVFNTSKISEKYPYKIFAPIRDNELMARMVVQNGAFLFREQVYESSGQTYNYQNYKPFDDIVEDEIIIPNYLKANLKEYLQRKLFDFLMFPRLILGQKIPDMSTFGERPPYEELLKIHRPEIERCMKSGNRHSDY